MKGLELERVRHAYGRTTVLHDVSLDVGAGELVCLLGPSGCGKSTLLRLAAGLEPLQAGRIAIAGAVVAEPGRTVPPERRGVGLVFQDFALFPHLCVADNVGFGLRGLPAERRRSRALDLLATIGMAAAADQYPHTLSGGQQQRVALARALAPEPHLVLLDEPFSGLDSSMRERLREDFLALLRQAGVTALMVTHDAEEAMYMAEHIAVMEAGRISAVATPHDLYFRPANRFVAGVFGELNTLAGTVRDGAVDTVLGRFPAAGLADGTAAQVLVRPEAIRPADLGAAARVVSVRMLGRAAAVQLAVGEAADAVTLRARVSSLAVPRPGDRLRLAVEPRLVHVFPAAG